MDRYGASTRDCESDDVYDYDLPRRGGPLNRDADYDRGYGRSDSTRERETFRAERSGRGHRSGFDGDRPREGADGIRGVEFRRRDLSPDDLTASEFEHIDNELHGRRSRRADGNREVEFRRRDLSPDYLTASEYEHIDNELHGRGSRRGAAARHTDRRVTGEYSDDESEFEPRATREGRGGLGVRSGAEPRRRADLPSSSMDDEFEDEPYGARREYGRDTRGRMHPRRRGQNVESDDDLDDCEDEGTRGGRRGAISYGGSSGRDFH